MNIETNAVAIRRNIRNIGTARTKLVEMIQLCALAVIQHAHVHGDVTLASDLCLAVGNGMKHEALRVYLTKFGPMVPTPKGKVNKVTGEAMTAPMSYSKGKRLEGEALADMMSKAAAEMWYSAPTERSAEAFNFAADLHRLLAKLEKASQTGYEPTPEEKAVIDAARKVPKPQKKAAAQEASYEPTF